MEGRRTRVASQSVRMFLFRKASRECAYASGRISHTTGGLVIAQAAFLFSGFSPKCLQRAPRASEWTEALAVNVSPGEGSDGCSSGKPCFCPIFRGICVGCRVQCLRGCFCFDLRLFLDPGAGEYLLNDASSNSVLLPSMPWVLSSMGMGSFFAG